MVSTFDARSRILSELVAGDYKQDYSQTTTTCCATKGIPGSGVPNSVPRKGDWYMSDDAMADTCDRGLYGITDHCQTEFELKIEICNDCSCVSSKNPQVKTGMHVHRNPDQTIYGSTKSLFASPTSMP